MRALYICNMDSIKILRYAHVPPQSSISLGNYQIEDDGILAVSSISFSNFVQINNWPPKNKGIITIDLSLGNLSLFVGLPFRARFLVSGKYLLLGRVYLVEMSEEEIGEELGFEEDSPDAHHRCYFEKERFHLSLPYDYSDEVRIICLC